MKVVVREFNGQVFEPAECPFQSADCKCRHFGRSSDKVTCGYPLRIGEPPRSCPLRRAPAIVTVTTDEETEFPDM